MLAFTPDVQLALKRFDEAHTLVNADGRFWWQPLAATDGTTSNRDVEAMTFLRAVQSDLLRPKAKKDPTDA